MSGLECHPDTWSVQGGCVGLLVEGRASKQVSIENSEFRQIGDDLKHNWAISASLVCVLLVHFRLN